MVEFVFVLPVMLLLLAGAIDLGRLFYAYIAVENAAKEGALYGARAPLCDDGANPGCGDPNNVVWHVENEAPNIGDGFTTAVACRNVAGALVQPMNDCLDGYTYQVTVSYPFRLITPILGSLIASPLTLQSESQATVITDAFDPAGLELLVWVDRTGAENSTDIASACTEADSGTSPNFYYAPCQDAFNVNQYMQFQEARNVNYKVRVRNTGNLDLTNIIYQWRENGSTVATPGTCSSLPANLAKNAPPAYCTFTRSVTAVNPVDGIADYIIEGTAEGHTGSLSTGVTNGVATIHVIPIPKLLVILSASPYQLGGEGNGLAGAPDYGSADLTLQRGPTSPETEIANPTAWLFLRVINQGGEALNLTVTVSDNGSALALPCSVPSSLAETGQPASSFGCIFPRTFSTTGSHIFATVVSADNAVIVPGSDPTVAVTTATDCAANKPVIPNLVDTLNPTVNGSSKTVGQAKTLWAAAGFSSSIATTPLGMPNSSTVLTQSRTAYTCAANASTSMTLGAK